MDHALLNMDEGRLTDVSNAEIGACSLERTVVIKTEPVEFDRQENVWDEIQTKIVKEKGPDVVLKIKTENMEDGLEHVSNITGTETMNRNIQKDISDQVELDYSGMESIQNKPKSHNKEGNKQQDIQVVIKTENMDKDVYECALNKMKTTNMKKHGKINSAVINTKAEVDLEEKVIVVNENTKFRNGAKRDTSTFSRICQTCGMAFRWPHQLKDHINFVHEGNSPYTCKVCGKSFKEARFLKVHKGIHTEERPHCCKLCPSRFKLRAGLAKHMQTVHVEKTAKFKCEHCTKVFNCKENLVRHLVVHQSEKKFACEICGKKVYHKTTLKDHLLTHSEEKNFECTECGKKFKRKLSLKLHRLNHLEVRPYKCDFCDKSFSRNQVLKRHLQVHTGDRPYKCRYCEKSFGRNNQLKRHLLHVHGEEKPYKCNFCDESFGRNPELKRHLQLHTEDRLYRCQYCNRSFIQLDDLQLHEKRHTMEKDFECGICGKVFVIQGELTDHRKIHTEERPYKCELCSYKAKTNSDLKAHMKVHSGERPYKCEFCSYKAKTKSALTVHMRVHSGERPFKCEICPYRAKRQSALLYHERAHERNTLKALKAQVNKNETHLKSDSVTKNNEAVRDTDTEAKENLQESLQSRMKFKGHADKLANVKEENSKDLQQRNGIIHTDVIVAETEDFVIVKNESFSPPRQDDDTVAQAIRANNFYSSDLDGVVNSDTIVTETEDFVIVKNESFSPPR